MSKDRPEPPAADRPKTPARRRPSPDLDEMVILALGGNLPGAHGSPAATICAAFDALAAEGLRLVGRSDLWTSRAWPRGEDPSFVNAVALAEPPPWSPLMLLSRLQAVERRFGVRQGAVNGPRVLDVDLIAFGRRRLTAPRLVLPHPRAAERLFVMGPLAEVAPDWRDPVTGRSAGDLAAAATVGRDAAPIT